MKFNTRANYNGGAKGKGALALNHVEATDALHAASQLVKTITGPLGMNVGDIQTLKVEIDRAEPGAEA